MPAPAPEDLPPGAALSAAEARFELIRGRVGLLAGPTVGAVVWMAGSGGPAGRLAAVMAFTAIYWITEALPLAVTSLLAAAAVVLLGIAPARDAFAAFGHPILFLFVGSFFIAEAMSVHGLGERFARALARVARGRLGLLVALSFAAFALSMWISNTAATAVALPIAVSVARASGDRRYGAALVLSIAYGASMGGLATPVGTPPNLIGLAALREAGIQVGFVRWMSVGLPIAAAMLLVLWALLAVRFRLRPGTPIGPGVAQEAARRPWSSAEVAVAVAFGVAVILWVVPGVIEVAAPSRSRWFKDHLTEEVAAILAAAILFAWPARDAAGAARPALTWREAARIDWATVLLFGGGILLGDLAGKTGLARTWGDALVGWTGAHSVWGITALVTAVSILLSEATSNTATATLMLPLTLSLAEAAGVSPVPPALGATIGSSFGFMMPISTAPNAMAYGTRQVTLGQMMSAGVPFDVLGFLLVVFGLMILCPLLRFI